MTNDSISKHLGTAMRLAGVNVFYTRRVLQRCERGEITLEDAAELLIAAAQRTGATIDVASVRRWTPDTLP
jgi:hypothetical protein